MLLHLPRRFSQVFVPVSISILIIAIVAQSVDTSEASNIQTNSKQSFTGRGKRRTMVIPAYRLLYHNNASEKAEDRLGHVRIVRRSGNEVEIPMQGQTTDQESSSRKKVKDLQEIFKILGRRDGELLNQINSLRQALDEMYGVLEFMGVEQMPPDKRNDAVRKVLQRAISVARNKRKRFRLRRQNWWRQ